MRTSCIIENSKIMVHHNGELTWGLEKTLGVLIHKVEWVNSKEFYNHTWRRDSFPSVD